MKPAITPPRFPQVCDACSTAFTMATAAIPAMGTLHRIRQTDSGVVSLAMNLKRNGFSATRKKIRAMSARRNWRRGGRARNGPASNAASKTYCPCAPNPSTNRTCCGSTDGIKYRGNSLEASTKSQAPNQRIESGCKSQRYQLLAGQPCQRRSSKGHRHDEQSCCRKTNARDCAESQHHPIAKRTLSAKCHA